MTEITSKIESIRNMKDDLNSIKMVSQKNTEKMFQDLADFRHRICHAMSKIETIDQSVRKHQRKTNQNNGDLTSNNDETSHSKRMNFILNEIENVQKKSKQMLIELDSYSQPSSLSQMRTVSRTNCLSSTDTFDSGSNFDEVNVLFSTQRPANVTNSLPPSTDSRPENCTEVVTKDKIDKLTTKLKDIQTQNDELRNVNENIQNLLMKLGDLKYVDAETVEKLETVKMASQMSSSTCLSRISSESILKDDGCQKYIRTVQITSKCRHYVAALFG